MVDITTVFEDDDPVEDAALYNNLDTLIQQERVSDALYQSSVGVTNRVDMPIHGSSYIKTPNTGGRYAKQTGGAAYYGEESRAEYVNDLNLAKSGNSGFRTAIAKVGSKFGALKSKLTPKSTPAPGLKDLKLGSANTSRPTAPAMPTGAQRQMIGQASLGQTRELIRMEKHGYDMDQWWPVEYVARERCNRFEVTMGNRLLRNGKTFDTLRLKKQAGGPKGGALQMKDLSQRSHEIAMKWITDAAIWVCVSTDAASKPVFYSGICDPGKFHHSSLSGGSEVICAGEWIVKDGKLLGISAVSGHYKPPLSAFFSAILHMSQALQGDTTVLMWNIRDREYEEVPVRSFISSPSAIELEKTRKGDVRAARGGSAQLSHYRST